MRYRVGRYHRIGNVEYQAGQILDIDDPEYAAWLARDMRGHLEPVLPGPEEPEAARVVESPPSDRMVRKPRRRSKAT